MPDLKGGHAVTAGLQLRGGQSVFTVANLGGKKLTQCTPHLRERAAGLRHRHFSGLIYATCSPLCSLRVWLFSILGISIICLCKVTSEQVKGTLMLLIFKYCAKYCGINFFFKQSCSEMDAT